MPNAEPNTQPKVTVVVSAESIDLLTADLPPKLSELTWSSLCAEEKGIRRWFAEELTNQTVLTDSAINIIISCSKTENDPLVLLSFLTCLQNNFEQNPKLVTEGVAWMTTRELTGICRDACQNFFEMFSELLERKIDLKSATEIFCSGLTKTKNEECLRERFDVLSSQPDLVFDPCLLSYSLSSEALMLRAEAISRLNQVPADLSDKKNMHALLIAIDLLDRETWGNQISSLIVNRNVGCSLEMHQQVTGFLLSSPEQREQKLSLLLTQNNKIPLSEIEANQLWALCVFSTRNETLKAAKILTQHNNQAEVLQGFCCLTYRLQFNQQNETTLQLLYALENLGKSGVSLLPALEKTFHSDADFRIRLRAALVSLNITEGSCSSAVDLMLNYLNHGDASQQIEAISVLEGALTQVSGTELERVVIALDNFRRDCPLGAQTEQRILISLGNARELSPEIYKIFCEVLKGKTARDLSMQNYVLGALNTLLFCLDHRDQVKLLSLLFSHSEEPESAVNRQLNLIARSLIFEELLAEELQQGSAASPFFISGLTDLLATRISFGKFAPQRRERYLDLLEHARDLLIDYTDTTSQPALLNAINQALEKISSVEAGSNPQPKEV